MGPRGAGGYHHPGQLPFYDNLLHLYLCIFRTSKEVVFYIVHIRKGFGVFHDLRDVSNPAYVNTAMTDKDTYFYRFLADIPFRGILLYLNPCSPYFCKGRRSRGCCGACLGNGLGDILGGLKSATHIDPLS